MFKQARWFLLFSLIVMLVFGYGVRTVLMAPKQPVGGPRLTSHDLNEGDGDCNMCHGKVKPWHEEVFLTFDNNDCMNCHGGAPASPHPAGDATYADCLSCHAGIAAGHDEMFPWPKTTYEDCLSCH
ncbi:MAG TPA: hypothetical protein GX699_09015 [Firmicutes bacterium]|nr:hypothetical protein [Bacillota bacterium]